MALYLVLLCCAPLVALSGEHVVGTVFEDTNLNSLRDPGEPGVPGVLVSNQREVVRTDELGRYSLPLLEDGATVFVIKPPTHDVPVDESMLPQFYYVHQPDGSPELGYGGIPPTGPLPESVDFGLLPSSVAETFDVLVFAETQPRDHTELGYIRDDVIAEVVGSDAAFGLGCPVDRTPFHVRQVRPNEIEFYGDIFEEGFEEEPFCLTTDTRSPLAVTGIWSYH